jgi:hypothetical protein
MCVNCERICGNICPGNYMYPVMSPCISCTQQKAAYHVLRFKIQEKIYYPIFLDDIIVNASRNSIDVSYNLSAIPGSITCAAVVKDMMDNDRGTTLTQQSIRQMGVSRSYYGEESSTNDASDYIEQFNGVLTIPHLYSNTQYYIACSTSDHAGHMMPLSIVVAHHRVISTQCCPGKLVFRTSYFLCHVLTNTYLNYLKFELNYVLVLYVVGMYWVSTKMKFKKYDESDISTMPIFVFQLDSPPVATTVLHITPQQCSASKALPSGIIITPSIVTFDTNAITLSTSFSIRSASSGCLRIVISDETQTVTVTTDNNSSETITNTTTSYNSHYTTLEYNVEIMGSNYVPLPPKIRKSYFSNDGRKIIVEFDGETNQGMWSAEKKLCSSFIDIYNETTSNLAQTCTLQWLDSERLVLETFYSIISRIGNFKLHIYQQ